MATPAEQAFPAQPGYFAGQRIIASPFQFVADADTFLRVRSACSVSGVVLAVQGRRIDAAGQLQAITETHTPNSDRSVHVQDYDLGAGALLNLTVYASSGSPLIGQCYVQVQLLRNQGGTAIVLGTLLGGYVTSTQALGFPGSPIVGSTDGEPVVRNILGTRPAAGGSILETCPTGARWELITLFFQLTTSATVATRTVFVQLTIGGQVGTITEGGGNQSASTTGDYTFAQNLTAATDLSHGIYAGAIAQRQFLRAADTFAAGLFSGQVGDQFSAPSYQVREWLEVG